MFLAASSLIIEYVVESLTHCAALFHENGQYLPVGSMFELGPA